MLSSSFPDDYMHVNFSQSAAQHPLMEFERLQQYESKPAFVWYACHTKMPHEGS
jgi:hypothetical protein